MTDLATGHYQKIMRLKNRIKKKDAEIERLKQDLFMIQDYCSNKKFPMRSKILFAVDASRAALGIEDEPA